MTSGHPIDKKKYYIDLRGTPMLLTVANFPLLVNLHVKKNTNVIPGLFIMVYDLRLPLVS